MQFYTGKLVPSKTLQKIKGPGVSISFSRSQVTFNKEASDLMGLVEKETFVLVGFDSDKMQVGFKVSKEKTESNAVVEKKVVKIPKAPEYMFIKVASVLEVIKEIPRKGVHKYPLHKSDAEYFYINISEGNMVPVKEKKSDSQK